MPIGILSCNIERRILKVAMVTTTQDATGAADRRFFTGMALAAVVIVFLGFGRSYYLRPFTHGALDPSGRRIATLPLTVHLHAAGFTAWILLLVAQVRLVAAGRTALHRRVGMVAACMVPFLVAGGLMTAVRGARDGWNPGGPFTDPLSFMIVPVADIVVFGVLVFVGLAVRRRPDIHKRLMLLATIGGLLPPAITRLPVVARRPLPMFMIFGALVLATAVWDFWHGSRYRWLSLIVGIAVLASVVLRPVFGSSAAWRTFAAWVVG